METPKANRTVAIEYFPPKRAQQCGPIVFRKTSDKPRAGDRNVLELGKYAIASNGVITRKAQREN